MSKLYFIGLDVHKRIISYCIKTYQGERIDNGYLNANRLTVRKFFESLEVPFVLAMEATMFSGWVYDLLKPLAVDLKVAHPEMLKAITASKKKNDLLDAEKICDLLRCNMLPECYINVIKLRYWFICRIVASRLFLFSLSFPPSSNGFNEGHEGLQQIVYYASHIIP